jgi:hypothetical protein
LVSPEAVWEMSTIAEKAVCIVIDAVTCSWQSQYPVEPGVRADRAVRRLGDFSLAT